MVQKVSDSSRIKIDHPSIRDIAPVSEDAAIPKAVTGMAMSLNLKVNAGGVKYEANLHSCASTNATRFRDTT